MNKLIDRLELLFMGSAHAGLLIFPAAMFGWSEYANILCLIALSLLGLSASVMFVILGALKLLTAWELRKLKREIEGEAA